MLFPVDTAPSAPVLALVYAALTAWVMVSRLGADTLQGDGGDALGKRIRAHGKFGEYVPLALVPLALVAIGFHAGGGGAHGAVLALLWLLLVGRLLHPFGLFARPSPARGVRASGFGA